MAHGPVLTLLNKLACLTENGRRRLFTSHKFRFFVCFFICSSNTDMKRIHKLQLSLTERWFCLILGKYLCAWQYHQQIWYFPQQSLIQTRSITPVPCPWDISYSFLFRPGDWFTEGFPYKNSVCCLCVPEQNVGPFYSHDFDVVTLQGKGKVIPLKARCGPEGG